MTLLRDEARRLLASRLLHDTVRLQAGQVLLVAIHAARSLLALRWLGPLPYGLYALAQSLVTTALLADVTAASRVAVVGTSRALAEERGGDPAAPLADCLRLSLAAAALLAAALWWLAPPLAGLAFDQPEVGGYARWLGVCLIAEVPFTILVVALQSARRMAAVATAETLRAAAWLAATVVALLASRTAMALVAAQVAASLLAGAAALVAYARLGGVDRRLPGWAALLARAARRDSRPALAAGVRIAVDKNLASFAAQAPILLLGAFDPAAVGYLAAGIRVMGLPGPLLTGLARNLDAVLPARAGAGLGAVRSVFLQASGYAALGWAGVAAVTALLAPPLLVHLLGPAYAPALALVPALALQSAVLGPGVGMGAVFRTLDCVARSIACQLVALAATLPAGFLLIAHLGAGGAAWFHALRTGVATALSFVAVLGLLRAGRPSTRAA